MKFPTAKNEINWTTASMSIPVILALGGVGLFVNDSIKENRSAIVSNERADQDRALTQQQTAKDFRESNGREIASMQARLSAQEQINAQYRLAALEAQITNTNSNVTGLKQEMAELRTEQRLTNQQLSQIIEFLRGGPIPPRGD